MTIVRFWGYVYSHFNMKGVDSFSDTPIYRAVDREVTPQVVDTLVNKLHNRLCGFCE